MAITPETIEKLIANGVYVNDSEYGFCKPVSEVQKNWLTAQMQTKNREFIYQSLKATQFLSDDDIGAVFSKLRYLQDYNVAVNIALHSYPFKNALTPHFELFSQLNKSIDELIAFLIKKEPTQEIIKTKLLKSGVVIYSKETTKKEVIVTLPAKTNVNPTLVMTWANEHIELFEQETTHNIKQKLTAIADLNVLTDYILNSTEFTEWANSTKAEPHPQNKFLDLLFKIKQESKNKAEWNVEILSLFDGLSK